MILKANQDFLVTIQSQRNGRKSNCLSSKSEFWICSGARIRIVEKMF